MPAAGFAALLVATYFLVDDLASKDQSYVQNAAQAAQNYRSDTQRYIDRACKSGAAVSPTQCEREARNASAQYEHEQHDLAAQRTSAWWTKIMGIAALIATVLSAVGVILIYRTFKRTQEQGEELRESLAQSTRTADAMEGVARSMEVNAQKIVESVGHQESFGKMQMRAYVSVGLAENPVYQDDRLNFAAEPTLTNTGHTPAHKLRWRTTASIEACPLPPGFKFELPEHGEGHSILMPHQVGTMLCTYPHRVDQEMVFQTMAGRTTAFYVWGIVEYEDVFGDKHETTFAHIYRWFTGNEVREDGIVPILARSHFLPMHNDAT